MYYYLKIVLDLQHTKKHKNGSTRVNQFGGWGKISEPSSGISFILYRKSLSFSELYNLNNVSDIFVLDYIRTT